MAEFPKIHNFAKPEIRNGKITFTYITSLGKVVTETKDILESEEIAERIKDRHERFYDSGPGTRESEFSRAERKYISAHPELILRKVWSLLDKDGKVEMSMMLEMNSHMGISDPKWAKEHTEKRNTIMGDDGGYLD